MIPDIRNRSGSFIALLTCFAMGPQVVSAAPQSEEDIKFQFLEQAAAVLEKEV